MSLQFMTTGVQAGKQSTYGGSEQQHGEKVWSSRNSTIRMKREWRKEAAEVGRHLFPTPKTQTLFQRQYLEVPERLGERIQTCPTATIPHCSETETSSDRPERGLSYVYKQAQPSSQ